MCKKIFRAEKYKVALFLHKRPLGFSRVIIPKKCEFISILKRHALHKNQSYDKIMLNPITLFDYMYMWQSNRNGFKLWTWMQDNTKPPISPTIPQPIPFCIIILSPPPSTHTHTQEQHKKAKAIFLPDLTLNIKWSKKGRLEGLANLLNGAGYKLQWPYLSTPITPHPLPHSPPGDRSTKASIYES